MAKLQLFISGCYICEEDFFLPQYDKENTSFETRTILREWALQAKIKTIRSTWHAAINKANADYKIVFVVSSEGFAAKEKR